MGKAPMQREPTIATKTATIKRRGKTQLKLDSEDDLKGGVSTDAE
jgi:hypothetical protein